MKSKIFSYGRVSSKEQNEDRQLVAFKEYGIIDSISGYGKYKSSVSYMNSKEEAENYINLLRKKI